MDIIEKYGTDEDRFNNEVLSSFDYESIQLVTAFVNDINLRRELIRMDADLAKAVILDLIDIKKSQNKTDEVLMQVDKDEYDKEILDLKKQITEGYSKYLKTFEFMTQQINELKKSKITDETLSIVVKDLDDVEDLNTCLKNGFKVMHTVQIGSGALMILEKKADKDSVFATSLS